MSDSVCPECKHDCGRISNALKEAGVLRRTRTDAELEAEERAKTEEASDEVKMFEGLMPPHMSVWAPATWIEIQGHLATLKPVISADDLDLIRTKLFLQAMLLPCPQCSRHFAEHIQKMDLTNPDFYRKGGLLRWVAMIRNNIRASKGDAPLSMRDAYTSMRIQMKQAARAPFQKKTSFEDVVEDEGKKISSTFMYTLIGLLVAVVGAVVAFFVFRSSAKKTSQAQVAQRVLVQP